MGPSQITWVSLEPNDSVPINVRRDGHGTEGHKMEAESSDEATSQGLL